MGGVLKPFRRPAGFSMVGYMDEASGECGACLHVSYIGRPRRTFKVRLSHIIHHATCTTSEFMRHSCSARYCANAGHATELFSTFCNRRLVGYNTRKWPVLNNLRESSGWSRLSTAAHSVFGSVGNFRKPDAPEHSEPACLQK